MNKRITVTQPFLPPLEEFLPYLEEIWKTKNLSNGGSYHVQLEEALARHLGVGHVSLLANGTLSLLVALAALDIRDEVITTPFSFLATTNALHWRGIKPVFADIDPLTLNIDPAKVEAAITPNTSAILAVHTYGQPCDISALQRIADTHGLKLIYDAAHSFGVRDGGGSILRHGDLSILSFHATKVFTTFEGGAIVCRDAEMKQRIDRLKNFGLDAEGDAVEAGINGKMNEIQAAFGLTQLKHLDQAVRAREILDAHYRKALASVRGIDPVSLMPGIIQNYSYFPVLVRPEYGETRDRLYERLQTHGIFARRYFHPLISNLPMYQDLPSADKERLPIANRCAEQVLCLPLYPHLTDTDMNRIIGLIQDQI